jgi:hypothetical protein
MHCTITQFVSGHVHAVGAYEEILRSLSFRLRMTWKWITCEGHIC